MDGSGDVYVADENNHVVKEILAVNGVIPASPTIITLGSGFSYPSGVAVDSSGNVYVADQENVVKEMLAVNGSIPPSPVINTLGSGFTNPWSIAVDAGGNVYVTEPYNNIVKEILAVNGIIPSNPVIETLGSGFSNPDGIAVDGSGNVYVADNGNNAVKEILAVNGKIPTTPTIVTLASGIGYPAGVAVDGSGNVYVADGGNGTVKQIVTVMGISSSINTLGSGFSSPGGVAVDSRGDVFVADYGNNRVAKLDLADPPSLIFASTASGSTSSDSPRTITVVNAGNAPLVFPIPSTGSNPNISTNFTLNDNGTSACPLLSANSSEPLTLAAGSSCQLPISFTPTVAGALTGSLTLTDNNLNAAAPGYATQSILLNGTGTQPVQTTPSISWATPSAISYGTPLSATQLNAASSVAGTFTYSPAAGTVLAAGAHTLTVTFTPTNTTNYTTATATVTLTVTQATPTINWATPTAITYGTALSATQLNAAASVAGTFTYSPAAGAVLTAGVQSLTATFAPTDTIDYAAITVTVALTVNQATPSIIWATPAPISSGTPLSATQLNASSTVAGTFTYSPAAGVVLTTGAYTLSVTFIPTDTVDYTTASGSVTLTVTPPPGFAPSNANFGTVNIGTASPMQTLTYTFGAPITLGSTAVLTQGATGLDFSDAGSDTCVAGTAYTAGQSCTVNVTFTPERAGTRNGAVVLNDNNANMIATAYLQGNGVGPQINFLPNTESTVAPDGLYPLGVAVDGSGNIYIADSLNDRILKESLSGGSYTQSTISTSSLYTPFDVALDASGNIYIADTNNYRVLKETPSAGGYSESIVADLSSSQIQPFGIAVDSNGNVYFSYILGTVYVETLSAGSYTQSTIQTGSSEIGYVAVDGSGNIYVADFANKQMLVETPSTGGYTQSTLPTSGLGAPWGVVVDGSGDVYISDLTNNTVLKETLSAGSYTQSFISTSPLDAPYGIAVDGSGNVYIADTGNARVLKEDFADAPSLTFASAAVGVASTDSPQTVTIANAGNAPLNFSGVSYPADFPAAAGDANACTSSTSLNAGAACDLPIDFTPQNSGSLGENVTLTDNALNLSGAQQNIAVTGTGIQSSQSITFPAIAEPVYVGGNIPLLAVSSSGLAVGFVSVHPSICTVSGTVGSTQSVSLLTAGECSIEAYQWGNSSYAQAPFVFQNFYVHTQPQTISFLPISGPVYAGNVVALSATATSSLAVSFVSKTPAVCTVSETGGAWSAQLLIGGRCTVHAKQTGNGAWSPAEPVAMTFTVDRNAQTITFPSIAEPVYVGGSVSPAATATSGLAVSYLSVHPAICTVSQEGAAWTINLVAVGECSVEAQQQGNAVYRSAPFAFQKFYVHNAPNTPSAASF